MADMEKQALLEEANRPLIESTTEEPTLDELSARLEQAKVAARDAHRGLLDAQRKFQQAWARTPKGRFITIALFTLLASVFLLPIMGIGYMVITEDDDVFEEYLPRRVPLEAHIMSKCPDARDCLHDLVLPAMVNVSNYVDFKLSFIGSIDDERDGVVCKHGQTECLGNIIELCAAHLYRDPKIYLGFTMCLSRNYSEIPSEDLVQDCALEHGIDFAKLNHCVSADDGERGVDMLRKSVQRSAAKGVNKSCTVRVDDKIYCIRDDGEWKDCEQGSDPKTLAEDILERRWLHSGKSQ